MRPVAEDIDPYAANWEDQLIAAIDKQLERERGKRKDVQDVRT